MHYRPVVAPLAALGLLMMVPPIFFWVIIIRYLLGVRSATTALVIESEPWVKILFAIVFPLFALGYSAIGLLLQKDYPFLKHVAMVFSTILLIAIGALIIYLKRTALS